MFCVLPRRMGRTCCNAKTIPYKGVIMNEKGENTVPELMRFFGIPGRPVGPAEFRTFWDSLTEPEKEYYRTAKIPAE